MSKTLYAISPSDELYHWKYIKKVKVNGKWRYYYNYDELRRDEQKRLEEEQREAQEKAKEEAQEKAKKEALKKANEEAQAKAKVASDKAKHQEATAKAKVESDKAKHEAYKQNKAKEEAQARAKVAADKVKHEINKIMTSSYKKPQSMTSAKQALNDALKKVRNVYVSEARDR